MSIEAIQAIQAIRGPDWTPALDAASAQSPGAVSFLEWAKTQVNEADRANRTAETSVQDLALGRAENLHEVMLNLEQARMSMELVVQVRNRLLEAYQDVIRMQI